MATEKRLIEELREMAERTPPICQYDRPESAEIFGKKIMVYCKPFEQFQELLRRAADALSVDAVEVSRLGKLGKLMIPYLGCPRGMIGPRGEDGEAKNRKFEILELDPITDIDGNRWVPVLDRDLSALKDKAQDIAEVVRCKDCKHMEMTPDGLRWCYVWSGINGMGDDGFCNYGERRTDAQE